MNHLLADDSLNISSHMLLEYDNNKIVITKMSSAAGMISIFGLNVVTLLQYLL